MKVRTRFFKVAALFLRIGLDLRKESILARRKGFDRAQAVMEKRHARRATELYDVAVRMGGVLIKLCQFFSTRQDLLPPQYISKLKGLQDEVPPVPFPEIEKVIHEEYKDFQDIFTTIDPIPLASASLGQIHRAMLKTGDEVILKILKPGITEIVDLDFAILYLIFRLFSNIPFFRKRMDFESLLDEFIRVTGDELNFRREAWIAKRFREAFKNIPYLTIPRVYDEYCTDRIIVLEQIVGDKITAKEKWLPRNNDPIVISRRIIEIYLEQFLFIKLIHFDPHPGNILVLSNNRLALLDFGMTGEITEKMSDGIKRVLSALIRRDHEGIVEILDDLGFFYKDADIYMLLPVIEYFFDEVLSTLKLERRSIMAIDLSPVVDDLVEIIYTHPVRLPVEWAYIGRTVGTIAGIISSLYPDINIYDELKPAFDRLIEENFKEEIAALRKRAEAYLKNLYILPGKATKFIQRIERGNLKFRFEQGEINKTLTGLKGVIIRGIGFIMALLSSFFSVALHLLHHSIPGIVFGILAAIFLLFSILYRKDMEKEVIKKRMMR